VETENYKIKCKTTTSIANKQIKLKHEPIFIVELELVEVKVAGKGEE